MRNPGCVQDVNQILRFRPAGATLRRQTEVQNARWAWSAVCQARDEGMRWITFHNHCRLHSTLAYTSPMVFEQKWQARQFGLLAYFEVLARIMHTSTTLRKTGFDFPDFPRFPARLRLFFGGAGRGLLVDGAWVWFGALRPACHVTRRGMRASARQSPAPGCFAAGAA